ncbi:hypothetical protein GCM10027289_24730 [Tsukamurella serpentis]
MTDDPNSIPPITAEWIARSADARAITLANLRRRSYWLRPLAVGGAVGVIAAVVCIIGGSGWILGLAIGGGFFALLTLEMLLLCLIGVHRGNRRLIFDGARWAAGSDRTRIRVDNPVTTVVVLRENVVSVQRFGAMVLLLLRYEQFLVVPGELFPALLVDPGLATIDHIDE